MECYSALKIEIVINAMTWVNPHIIIKNGHLADEIVLHPFTVTQMNLENLTINEISQKPKDKYYMIPVT